MCIRKLTHQRAFYRRTGSLYRTGCRSICLYREAVVPRPQCNLLCPSCSVLEASKSWILKILGNIYHMVLSCTFHVLFEEKTIIFPGRFTLQVKTCENYAAQIQTKVVGFYLRHVSVFVCCTIAPLKCSLLFNVVETNPPMSIRPLGEVTIVNPVLNKSMFIS